MRWPWMTRRRHERELEELERRTARVAAVSQHRLREVERLKCEVAELMWRDGMSAS